MKKTISMTLIVIFCLAMVFSQAFASNVGSGSPKPKQTPDPNETPEVETMDDNGQQAKGNQHAGRKYNFKGEVTAFDGATLVITGKKGGTVTVDANTVIKATGPDAAATTTIQVGQQVMAQAVKNGAGYLAIRVHIFPSKPAHVHRVGTVTDYQPGVSITVQDKKGGSSTFQIAPDVKILPAERANQLAADARVTVISASDGAAGQPLVATGIVVHPDKAEK